MDSSVASPLRRVRATRYVVPLREGGSLPALIEADDLGTYVVKFRGAGQGLKTLVAEVVVGELGRHVGLPVPELVVAELDAALAPAEPDQEIQDLLRASIGSNLGMDYLPGSLGLDMTVDSVDPTFAARVVWFDALVQNVDRSWRNPNLLVWHGKPWLIDHGAALFWHHTGRDLDAAALKSYPGSEDHVLLGRAGSLLEAHEALAPAVTAETLRAVTALIPSSWLEAGEEQRQAYVDVLRRRVGSPAHWLDDVEAKRVQPL